MSLLEELEPRLARFLEKRGFRLIDEQRDSSFGNSYVIVESGGVWIRVIRDRGVITLEVAQQGSRQSWHLAANVLEFVSGAFPTDATIALESLFQQVADLMKSDIDQQGYLAFEQKKGAAMIERLFPKKPQ